jgi:hypothetical protein
MSLQGPNTEDLRKIHAETNQIANQRFLLTTASITIFGVMISWALPESGPSAGTPVGSLVCGISALLSVVLFALYLLNHFLKGMQRICTAYLVTTKASKWEEDYEDFRKSPHYGYTKPQAIIFLLLNLISTFFPFIFARMYSLKLEPFNVVLTCIILGSFFELMIYGMAWHNWIDLHLDAKKRWESLNKQSLKS